MRVVVASPPWLYRRMVGGSMVAGRWLILDAERLGAWRWVVSEFEETRSCLIQTGASFSSNLKHGSMPGDGRSLRCTAIIDGCSVIERHVSIRFSIIDSHMCAESHLLLSNRCSLIAIVQLRSGLMLVHQRGSVFDVARGC